MFLIPIGDEPNEKQTPWVNYGLIAANAIVFFLTWGGEESARTVEILERWGYVPAHPRVEALFTSMFLHAGWMHLIGNMLFLWIFGDNVEARLGRLKYLLVYLAMGAAAGLTFGLLRPQEQQPCVGASGAISGVLGVYFLAFPENKVKMLFWVFIFVRVFHVGARWVIGLWFLVNDVLPLAFKTYLLGDNTAHEAHVGGFVSGLVLYLLLRPTAKVKEAEARFAAGVGSTASSGTAGTWGERRDPYAGGRAAPPRWGQAGTLEEAPTLTEEQKILLAWRAGQFEAAAGRFASELRFGRVPHVPEPEFFRMCAYLYDHQQWDDSRRAFHAFLDSYPSSRNAPPAAFALGMVYSRQDRDAEKARPWLEEAARRHPSAQVRQMAEQELAAIRYRR